MEPGSDRSGLASRPRRIRKREASAQQREANTQGREAKAARNWGQKGDLVVRSVARQQEAQLGDRITTRCKGIAVTKGRRI